MSAFQPLSAGSCPTILVIDDLPANLGVVVDQLQAQGWRVVIAQDGEEGLARARFVQPDLVLLDIMMPGLDGFETCRRLKADEATCDIPVIFMTALGDLDDKLRGFAAGGVDYLPKPCPIQEVLARVGTHLALRTARQTLTAQNQALAEARDELEQRVAERTAELARANDSLHSEIAERHQASEELHASRQMLQSIIDNAGAVIYVKDLDGHYVLTNRRFSELFHLPQGAAAGKSDFDLLPAECAELCRAFDQQVVAEGKVQESEELIPQEDGVHTYLSLKCPLCDEAGRPYAVCGISTDITSRKLAEERANYLATHDSLTGLPNRSLLEDRLRQAIAQARREEQRVAVLFLDLDGFKQVNDTLGHRVGDRLLQDVAERLQNCVRASDSVARLGGDEFVVCIAAIADAHDAALVAQKILDALEAPCAVDGQELRVGGSIGISLYPADGEDDDTLMRTADLAMYSAKERGRGNYQFFTTALNASAQRRQQLAQSLRVALARDELELHYQPQVDLASGRIVGAEALLRWHQPQLGLLCSAEFLAVAEETGLIQPIGEWVLRKACSQLAAWRHRTPELSVAVNLSLRQFLHPGILDLARAVLDDTGLPAPALELEIGESLLLDRPDNAGSLQGLADMGVKLAVDDFGTGCSSLGSLQRFPIHEVKIDGSCVGGIGQDPAAAAIVAAIIALARSLCLRVVAEGVETAAQAAFLIAHGCQAAQGYYYGRPVPATAFGEMLRRQQAARRVVNR